MKNLFLPIVTLGTVAVANEIAPPVKIRLAKSLYQTVFNANDQKIFETFSDLKFNDFQKDDLTLENASLSLKEASGELKDFDFDISFNPENIGIGSTNVYLTGKGTVGEAAFAFEGPIDLFQFEYSLQ